MTLWVWEHDLLIHVPSVCGFRLLKRMRLARLDLGVLLLDD